MIPGGCVSDGVERSQEWNSAEAQKLVRKLKMEKGRMWMKEDSGVVMVAMQAMRLERETIARAAQVWRWRLKIAIGWL